MPIAKLTNSQFIDKAVRKWGEKYDYSKVEYRTSRLPVVIICRKHNHEFEQTPKAHFGTKHHCCPLCYAEVAGSFQNEWRNKVEPTWTPQINAALNSVLS